MTRNFSLALALILGFNLNAQNEVDALRYSRESLWGSARYVAMGGAFGSLGSNGNTASTNPAGIAVYTSGEFSGSLSFHNTENKSTYFDQATFDKHSGASLPNINYVSANVFNPEQVGDWNRYNFGIGYNKLDDYNQSIYFSSEQNASSLSNFFLEEANNSNSAYNELNSFTTQLAFNTYLLDTLGGITSYVSPVSGDLNKTQTYSSERSGSKNEFYLSFGTAYQDKLFIGATVAFPSIQYQETSSISEKDFTSTTEVPLDNFKYASHLNVSGSGINLKLGLIYKLDNNIRYGFAIHTPTYYEISEEYQSSLSTHFTNGDSYNAKSSIGFFDYTLNTPFKMINSLSFIINKRAIFSLDYEYLDYAVSNLGSDIYDFHDENITIDEIYTSTSNVKLGAEYRAHPQLSLRAGYAYYGSPYVGDLNDASIEHLTFGLGLKVNQYFFDLAVINSTSIADQYIYPGTEASSLDRKQSQAVISAGFKF